MRLRQITLVMGAVTVLAHLLSAQADVTLQRAMRKETLEGDLKGAIALYEKTVAEAAGDRATAAKALIRMAECYQKLGNSEARKIYERVAREYADQKDAANQARAWLTKEGGAAVERAVTARRLWAGNEATLEGSPSADGRYLAFVDWTTRGNIAIRDLATGEKRLVTQNAGNEFGYGGAVFSPDGKQVAYQWCCRNNELRVSNTDGSGMRVLIRGRNQLAYPYAWSPDGTKLAGVLTDYGDATNAIILVSVADGSLHRLKTGKWSWPDVGGFSPDGKFLSYATVKDTNGPGGVFVIAVDGSSETTLVEGPADFRSPAWSPDGNTVVFPSDRSGTMGLWAVQVRNGKPQGAPELLKAAIGNARGMRFARDGSYFYGTSERQQHVYVAEFDAAELAFRSAPRILSNECVGCNSGPAWSPDGKLVAFARTVGQKVRFVVKSMADGSERVLPNEFERPYFAARSGLKWIDARTFLVTDTVNSRRKFFAVNAETGESRLLMDGPYHTWPPAVFSPDGKIMYYTAGEISEAGVQIIQLRLMRRDLKTGEERSLYEAESTGVGFFGMTVSPGGDRIAFMTNATTPNNRSLYVMPTDGGPVREIFRGTFDDSVPASATWTRDGRYIITALRNRNRNTAVWKAFPVESGEPRIIDPNIRVEELYSPSFSPDGRRLVFAGVRSSREVWIVKNLLPEVRAGR
jgi:Tol biopolymer transport system component